MPSARSGALVVLVTLAVVTGGCMSAFSSMDSNGATPNTSEATTRGSTGNATATPTASRTTDGRSPANGVGSSQTPTNRTANGSVTDSGVNTLIVERRAIRVESAATNGSREYITLRLDTGPEIRRSPLDLSGYTVQFGNGPTYTIPKGITLGPIPGGGVYLWTGPGADRTLGIGDDGRKSQYVLHAGYDRSLLTENTTITVRDRRGEIVARKVVTPTAGTVPFVLTRPVQSIETLTEAKRATPFALRAPTYIAKGYRFDQLRITPRYDSYTLFYSRNPNNYTDDISVGAVAPQATNESDRPDDARPVMVDGQRGYYTIRNMGEGERGYLWFIGPEGWGYFVNGPSNRKKVLHIAESIEVVENHTAE